MAYDPRAGGALCDQCPLNDKKPVPPGGNPQADLVIVGEAPGYWEERKGSPFIGPSGVKLDEILYFAGVQRSQVYVTNTVLCRAKVPHEDGPKSYDLRRYIAWIRAENLRRKKEAKATGGTYQPISSPIDCCAPRLWRELAWHEGVAKQRGQPNGAVIIPTGNFALEAITGRTGILKHRGAPMVIDLNDPFKPQNGEPEKR